MILDLTSYGYDTALPTEIALFHFRLQKKAKIHSMYNKARLHTYHLPTGG